MNNKLYISILILGLCTRGLEAGFSILGLSCITGQRSKPDNTNESAPPDQKYAKEYAELSRIEMSPEEYKFLRSLAFNLYIQLGYKKGDNLFVFRPASRQVRKVIRSIQAASYPALADSLIETYRMRGSNEERIAAGFKFDTPVDIQVSLAKAKGRMVSRALDLCAFFVETLGETVDSAVVKTTSARSDHNGSEDLRDGWFTLMTCRKYLSSNKDRLSLEFIDRSPEVDLAPASRGKGSLSIKEDQHRRSYEDKMYAEMKSKEYSLVHDLAINLFVQLGFRSKDLFVFRPDKKEVSDVVESILTAPTDVVAESIIETYRQQIGTKESLIVGAGFFNSRARMSKADQEAMVWKVLSPCQKFIYNFGDLIESAAIDAKEAGKNEYGSSDLRDGWFIAHTCRSILSENPKKLTRRFIDILPSKVAMLPRDMDEAPVNPAQHQVAVGEVGGVSFSNEASSLDSRELQYADTYERKKRTDLASAEYPFLRNMAVNLYFRLGYETDDSLFKFRPSDPSVDKTIKSIRFASVPSLAGALVDTYRLCGQRCERMIAGSKSDQGYEMCSRDRKPEFETEMARRALDLCRKFIDSFGGLIKQASADAAKTDKDHFGSQELRDGWFIASTCYSYLSVSQLDLTRNFIHRLKFGELCHHV